MKDYLKLVKENETFSYLKDFNNITENQIISLILKYAEYILLDYDKNIIYSKIRNSNWIYQYMETEKESNNQYNFKFWYWKNFWYYSFWISISQKINNDLLKFFSLKISEEYTIWLLKSLTFEDLFNYYFYPEKWDL